MQEKRGGPRKKSRLIATCMLLTMLLPFVLLSGAHADYSIVYAEASGKNVILQGKITIDYSNADKGYIMMKHSGSDSLLAALVTYDGTQSRYNLSRDADTYITIPLKNGSGTYSIVVAQHVKGNSYTDIYNGKITVEVPNPYAAFLAPSMFVWYEPGTKAIAKSQEICVDTDGDMNKAKLLYNFVGDTISYDYMKALSVQANKEYLPDVDETLETRMGVCFDYAALLACMLRVQGIPTELVMGDLVKANQYHAWNKVYIDGNWYLLDATFKDAGYSKDDYVEDRFF